MGAAVLVAGITFIGGYTGLRMSPFCRSLMIVGAAATLGAGSYVLAHKERWEALSQWLRSASAAVFLFACFASSSIPGLLWVTSLAPALGILGLGVVTNLYVAHATAKQAFASLHVVLSLIPLTLVPQSEISIVLATVVVAVGIAMAYRTRWDLHTLITLAAFALFHLTWYDTAFATTANLTTRVIGAISTLTVGMFVALMHYRKTYASERIETLPFLVHVGNWDLLFWEYDLRAGLENQLNQVEDKVRAVDPVRFETSTDDLLSATNATTSPRTTGSILRSDFSRPNNSVTSSSMICWMNSCAFSLTIPSSVSHIGLLDAPWGPAISSLMRRRSFPRTVTGLAGLNLSAKVRRSLFTHPLILALWTAAQAGESSTQVVPQLKQQLADGRLRQPKGSIK